MVMTQGGAGGDVSVRRREQERSAKLLQAEEVFWGGYQDTEVPLGRDLIQTVEEIVRKIEPHFIFVHYHDDTHQDHRHLAMSTITATRYTKNVLFYEGPTTQNFAPTVFVDIQQALDRKIQALEAHASQVKKTNIEGIGIADLVKSSAHFRGIQGRVKTAEGFLPLRLFINIGV
jgi:LmbE family N-acetylglucosaminyl deacetylase